MIVKCLEDAAKIGCFQIALSFFESETDVIGVHGMKFAILLAKTQHVKANVSESEAKFLVKFLDPKLILKIDKFKPEDHIIEEQCLILDLLIALTSGEHSEHSRKIMGEAGAVLLLLDYVNIPPTILYDAFDWNMGITSRVLSLMFQLNQYSKHLILFKKNRKEL